MRDIPIEVLLSFPTPNYKNPDTQGSALLIINAVFASLVFVVVSLRIYTRIYIKRWLGADDIFILIAALFTIGLNAAVILANARYYWDRHVWDIPLTEFAVVGQIAMAAKALFTLASFFTRVSLLCFYYRLTSDTNSKRYKWVLHLAMVFNIAVCIAFGGLTIFQCTPISAYWTFPASGKCVDEGQVTLAAGIINCVADILITALPIPILLKLKMPLRQRLGVIVLLSLGFVVTVAGIIRTYFIWKCLIDSYDETWYAYPLWICAAVEIDLAVLCASAPALRPLLLQFARPIVNTIGSLYSGGSSRPHASKIFGVLSYTSNPMDHSVSNMDYELEKGKAQVNAHEESGPTPRIPRKLSKRKTPEPLEEHKIPPRLAIVERHSVDVQYEDRLNNGGPSRRTSTEFGQTPRTHSGLRDWPLSGTARLATHHGGGGSSRNSMIRRHSRAPILSPTSPVSALSESFLYGGIEQQREPPSPQEDSFYFSNASVKDEEDVKRRSHLGTHGESWRTESARPEVYDGERIWEIGDNSSRDDEGHVLASAGVPEEQWTAAEESWFIQRD